MKKYEKIISKFAKKPWGDFKQFIENIPCSVKILTIKPKEELSLQYHQNRDEFWYILSGAGEIMINNKKYQAVSSKEFFILRKIPHQAKAGNKSLKILEISLGQFAETDIVRLSDKYNR